jgi:hypothetical protein
MMGTRDPRVDAYISKAPPFAQPILTRLRSLVHDACPQVTETLKWSVPAFEYKGPFCGVAAFKQHCMFGFWKAPLLAEQGFKEAADNSLRYLKSMDDLPSDRALVKLIKAAAALNDSGARVNRLKMAPKPPPKAPAYFLAAVRKNRKAAAAYEGFSPSHKREYIEWVTEAKTAETRDRRLAQAVSWMAEGKSRNWKYQ